MGILCPQGAMGEAMSRRIRGVFNAANFWTIVLYNVLSLNSLEFAKMVGRRLIFKGGSQQAQQHKLCQPLFWSAQSNKIYLYTGVEPEGGQGWPPYRNLWPPRWLPHLPFCQQIFGKAMSICSIFISTALIKNSNSRDIILLTHLHTIMF